MKKDQVTGDRSRLTAAFLEYRSVLAGMVGRIVKPHDIEDIVQETFIRCFEAERKHGIRHPRSFMLKTARNLAINHITRADQKLAQQLADFPSSDVYSVSASAESSVETRERFLLFCRAVRQLPLQCRRAFLLKKVYGFTQREIADFMGLSQSTIEKHVIKGLMMCSEYMARETQELAAAAKSPDAYERHLDAG